MKRLTALLLSGLVLLSACGSAPPAANGNDTSTTTTTTASANPSPPHQPPVQELLPLYGNYPLYALDSALLDLSGQEAALIEIAIDLNRRYNIEFIGVNAIINWFNLPYDEAAYSAEEVAAMRKKYGSSYESFMTVARLEDVFYQIFSDNVINVRKAFKGEAFNQHFLSADLFEGGTVAGARAVDSALGDCFFLLKDVQKSENKFEFSFCKVEYFKSDGRFDDAYSKLERIPGLPWPFTGTFTDGDFKLAKGALNVLTAVKVTFITEDGIWKIKSIELE
jgi:hypothetical protein